jgi:hypothetical protein
MQTEKVDLTVKVDLDEDEIIGNLQIIENRTSLIRLKYLKLLTICL